MAHYTNTYSSPAQLVTLLQSRGLNVENVARPWIAIPVNQKKAYFSLCIIKYFLDIISPNNDMKDKIDTLLSAYSSIDTSAMGFPRGWENEPLWQ